MFPVLDQTQSTHGVPFRFRVRALIAETLAILCVLKTNPRRFLGGSAALFTESCWIHEYPVAVRVRIPVDCVASTARERETGRRITEHLPETTKDTLARQAQQA